MSKAKGSRAERELLDIFTENGWSAARVAGSGVNENTFCDVIAGKKGKMAYAIEAKSSKHPRIYITKQQISDFIQFSEIMGFVPVVAVRFNREGWLFINPLDPDQLEDSGANLVVNLKNAKTHGKRFGQFFETQAMDELTSGF